MSVFNLSATGEVDGSIKPKDVTDSTVTAMIGTEPVKQGEEKQKMIVLDGPLSHIYTQALNDVYAKEDTGTMSMINEYIRNKTKEAESQPHGTYVYVDDGSEMTPDRLTERTNYLNRQVSSKDFKNYLLVLEHRGIVNPRMELLSSFAQSIGMEVIQHRAMTTSALESLYHKANK